MSNKLAVINRVNNLYSNNCNYIIEHYNSNIYYTVINSMYILCINDLCSFDLNFYLNKKIFIKNQKYYRKTYIYYYFKLIFKGKGFRIRKFKNKNKLTFNFGHSHWAKVIYNSFFLFKLRRQNYPFYLIPYNIMLNLCILFRGIKKSNRYTKRGLRLKRQILQRRFGKVSQMVSSLH